MKITVCDICRKDGKLTESTRYMTIKGHSDLRLDYCDECKSKIPKDTKEYIKLVYKLVIGGEVSDEEIKKMFPFVK